ncbi:hypothetical protein [Roseateles sp.]|uniref:hypothetical protein n=1 Tax=Roseateles sp. TaxID=1971397 RepID=UPI002F428A93
MSTISARPVPVTLESGQDAGFRGRGVINPGTAREWALASPADSATREQAQLAERRAAASTSAAMAAAAEAASNSGGLGASAEEITFGASERAELETHDEARDAREGKDARVEALMRIEVIHELLRQLGGDRSAALVRQRAERFSALWQRGEQALALDELGTGSFGPLERAALLNLALRRRPDGPATERLEALLLEDLEADPGKVVTRLLGSLGTGGLCADGMCRPPSVAPESPWLAAVQSPSTPKLVLEAGASLGPEGLDKLAALSVPRGRVDGRLSRGAEVFLSLSLLRMIQQVRQVEALGARLLDAREGRVDTAGAGGRMNAPNASTGAKAGHDRSEEVRKVTRWLLETTFAAAPQGALARIGTVFDLKAGDPRLHTLRRLLQRRLGDLPDGVWLNADVKAAVSAELKKALTAAMERQGELTRFGLVRPHRPIR